MKFIPFLPLTCLLVSAALIFNGWDILLNGENSQEPKFASDNQSIIQIQNFFDDWFGWQNPKKSEFLLFICISIFVCWLVLPTQVFVVLTIICYIIFVIIPLHNSNALTKIVTGFWFCT